MKVGHETPINGTAARVMARGEHYEFKALETTVCSQVPLPTRQLEHGADLSGCALGRLRVIGLSDSVRGRWVCRCSCGNYVLQKAIAIKKAAPDSACPQCYLLALARRADFMRRTGRHRETWEFMQ